MNADEKQRLREYLEGTCADIMMALEHLDIDADADDAEEAMEELNLERCPGCDWWMESSALIDDDSNVVGCDQCRQREDA